MTFTRTDIGALDLNLLNALVALVEEKSTTEAARRLGLAQSTVSGTLAKLRDAFDDELLVRQGRGLEPTPRALELAAACAPHIESLLSAVAAIQPFDPKGDSRVFRFGCTDAVALAILPALTEILRKRAPECVLSVRVGDYRSLPEMLDTGEVSTVLGYLRDDTSATAKQKVLRHAPWMILRDTRQPKVKGLEDFCARPHALVTPAGDLTGFVDEEIAALGYQRRVALGVMSFSLLLPTLKGTDLLATVPDFVAASFAQLGGLAVDPCPVAVPPVTNTLAWRAAADGDPAEQWFRAAVSEAFAAS